MSAVYLLLICLCVFALAYRYYGAWIGAKVLMLDDRNITPSVSCNDGRDYVPTNKWVVFGHHFAAIAGAGPLIGPTLAAQYGWGPGFFWIMLGSVFAGCVHDMIILFGSVRHKGQSLAVIAKKDVGKLTGPDDGLRHPLHHHRGPGGSCRGRCERPLQQPLGCLLHRHDDPHRHGCRRLHVQDSTRRHPLRVRSSASSPSAPPSSSAHP